MGSFEKPAAGRSAGNIQPAAGGAAGERVSGTFPTRAGFSFLYELAGGWETWILREDTQVRKAPTEQALEDAFADPGVKIILIPRGSSVTRRAALRICRCHGAGKTVFYEGSDYGR